MPTLAQLKVALTPDLTALKAGLAEARAGLQGVAAAGNMVERELTAAAKRYAAEQARALQQVGREAAAAFRQQGAALKAAEAEWASFAGTIERESARGYGAMRKEIAATQAAMRASGSGQEPREGVGWEKYGAPGGPGQALAAGILPAPIVGALGSGALMVGGGVAAGLAVATKQAADFDSAMADVNSSALLTTKQLDEMHRGLLEMAKDPEVLTGPKDLAKALYEIVSVGYKGAEAIEIDHQAARLAATGLGDAATSAHLLIAVLQSGIPGVKSAAEAVDVLAKTVHVGAFHTQELAENFPRMIAVAKATGASLQELGAAYAALSRRGIDVGQANELFGQVLNRLLKPSREAQVIFDRLGVSYGETGLKATGLTGVLQQLAHAHSINADMVDRAMGRIQGLAGMLTLTDKNGQSYRDTLNAIKTATEGVGAATASITEQRKGMAGQWAEVRKEVDLLAISIGDNLLPYVKEAVGWLSRVNAALNGGGPQAHQLAPFLLPIALRKSLPGMPPEAFGIETPIKPLPPWVKEGPLVPPGIHPAEAEKAAKATKASREQVTAATKQMVAAQLELHSLEAQLTALHTGETTALAKLLEQYRLAPAPIREHIRAVYEQIQAFKESQAAAKKHSEELARQAKAAADAAKKLREEQAAAVRRHAEAQAALIADALGDVRVAAAELAALRGEGGHGVLSAHYLGVDSETIAALAAYQQQLKGIQNVTDIIRARTAPILDPAKAGVMAALSRYAGTGNLEAQTAQGQAAQLNRIAGILNQYQAGQGGGQDAAQRLGYLKQALGPDLMATLQKTVGDIDAFFGGIQTRSQSAADAIAKANQANQEAAQAYLTATTTWGAGLARNLSAMDQMVANIQAAALAALRSSAGSLPGRAGGGPVSGGSAYMVGERGPELFVPSSSGTVIPGGGASHVTVNMPIYAADAASFRYSQSQIMASAGRAIQYHMARSGA